MVPERLKRAIVAFNTSEAPGTIVIDTGNTQLYYVLGQGRAVRYGVGVGREGFTWSGVQSISKKAEWPDWTPPSEMIARQPYLPRFVAGGPGNPLGARAMYLGSSVYRIHGTNDPSTIGKFVSSGCIRLTNEDVADLFSRVTIGTKVVVLPKSSPHMATRDLETRTTISVRPVAAQPRPVMTRHARPPGDDRFDVVAVLTGDQDEPDFGQAMGVGSGGNAVRLGAGARSAGGRFLLGSCSGASAVRARLRFTCRLSVRAGIFAGRAAPARLRRRPGLLRAYLRRALFPGDRPDNKAGRRHATASARPAIPSSSTAAASTGRHRKRQTLFRTAECVSLSQRNGGGMHLQRQGPDRPRAGQDRERSDAAPGRHRRRRERAGGRRPRRTNAARRSTSRRPRIGSRPAISACRWWRGSKSSD